MGDECYGGCAHVGIDYHIEVAAHYYSVPLSLRPRRGRRARLTARTIEFQGRADRRSTLMRPSSQARSAGCRSHPSDSRQRLVVPKTRRTARPQLVKADTAFQCGTVGQPTEPCLAERCTEIRLAIIRADRCSDSVMRWPWMSREHLSRGGVASWASRAHRRVKRNSCKPSAFTIALPRQWLVQKPLSPSIRYRGGCAHYRELNFFLPFRSLQGGMTGCALCSK
jgi:hypothetical protein